MCIDLVFCGFLRIKNSYPLERLNEVESLKKIAIKSKSVKKNNENLKLLCPQIAS